MSQSPAERQASHTAFDEKLRIRLAVLEALGGVGAGEMAWVPFCGYGDLYGPLGIAEEAVYACDRDEGAVGHWRKTWPAAEAVVALAERVEFAGRGPFAFADCDAFNSPLPAVRHFLGGASLCDRVGVVTTTGILRFLRQRSQSYDFRRLRFGPYNREVMQEQVASWSGLVADWMRLEDGVAAVELVDEHRGATEQSMAYAGYLVTPRARAGRSVAGGGGWAAELAKLRGGPVPALSGWSEGVSRLRG